MSNAFLTHCLANAQATDDPLLDFSKRRRTARSWKKIWSTNLALVDCAILGRETGRM